MEVLVDRGAGIDVHKQSVTVCVMTTEGRTVEKTLQRFTTFHRDLVAMRLWLMTMGVTHVAMEATGEYWKPVYEVLEGSVELVVANSAARQECSRTKDRSGRRSLAGSAAAPRVASGELSLLIERSASCEI